MMLNRRANDVLPLAPERVKSMGALVVPSASNRPPLATTILTPEASCTVVPGSMVKVTPFKIVMLPQTGIGLSLACQVVLARMLPLKQGGGMFVVI